MSSIDLNVFDGLEYVSRGGQKLEKALKYFEISPEGKVCIDCGASTGGFTDCLLKHGAKLVYAVDVGYGQLAWSLRTDERVITMERTNIRYVTPDMLEYKPELAVIDLSFISLALVLPVVRELMTEKNEAICLIKPQFEAGKEKVGKKGVVRDPETHKEVLDRFIENAEKSGFHVKDITYSPVKGPKGNIEYLGRIGSNINLQNRKGITKSHTGAIVSESHKNLA
ncbi:MAG: TlyA family RNA methyltransferase [Oscillospiraceae bacterium]|nr:TlyA family RNA methyltransferase [Oscillospiraceae bacterium]